MTIIAAALGGALGYATIGAIVHAIIRDRDPNLPRPTWAERRHRLAEYRASRHHHLR